MTYLNPLELLENQDTWKRSQIRLPHSLYNAVNVYAQQENRSLNNTLLLLLDKGLTSCLFEPKRNGWVEMKYLNVLQGLKGTKYLLLNKHGDTTIGEIIKKENAHRLHEYRLKDVTDEYVLKLITTTDDNHFGVVHDIALLSDFEYWQFLPLPPYQS